MSIEGRRHVGHVSMLGGQKLCKRLNEIVKRNKRRSVHKLPGSQEVEVVISPLTACSHFERVLTPPAA